MHINRTHIANGQNEHFLNRNDGIFPEYLVRRDPIQLYGSQDTLAADCLN